MYREFTTPDDQEILEVLGEWPESDDEGSARLLTLRSAEGQRVLLSYDTLGRSVRVRWIDADGSQILDSFREGATRLSVSSTHNTPSISIEFESTEFRGTLSIEMSPRPCITDRLLYT